MEIINSRPRLSDPNDSKDGKTNNVSKGITKRLLEKYKPDGLYNIKRMNNGKDQKRLA